MTRFEAHPTQDTYKGLKKQRWDIFCTVIDNYGDIGVCWRLARQLSQQYDIQVRLWVDQLESLHAICPEVDPVKTEQSWYGINIQNWSKTFPVVVPADVVIEAFACRVPDSYLVAMANAQVKPIWINLEYLTAELWAAEWHGMASPHPTLPLTKYFFFPGFTERSGGLLPQEMTSSEHIATISNLPNRETGVLWVSLFAYENPAFGTLLHAFSHGSQAVMCLLPEGRLLPQAAEWLHESKIRAGGVFQRGQLELRVLPFMAQTTYESLLRLCDINFVRGEDSFIRAQWALKPFVWHIYPQTEQAHEQKLKAFLDCYCQGLPGKIATDLMNFWYSWNRGVLDVGAWEKFWQHAIVLQQHAQHWGNALNQQTNLITRLVQFCMEKQRINGL